MIVNTQEVENVSCIAGVMINNDGVNQKQIQCNSYISDHDAIVIFLAAF